MNRIDRPDPYLCCGHLAGHDGPCDPSAARLLDSDVEWMIRHLRCEWGIRTPQECNQINDPCVPCALRMWLDGIPTLDEDARAAIAAAKARRERDVA